MNLDGKLSEFVARWKLDDRATRLLSSLSHSIVERVIRDFVPKHTSVSASAALTAFVRSVSRYHANNQETLQAQMPILIVESRNGDVLKFFQLAAAEMYLAAKKGTQHVKDDIMEDND